MFTLRSQQELEDFTYGCCFFGTGGGGNPEFGQRMLADALEAGKTIEIISSHKLADSDWIVCPYLMGTSGPETLEVKQEKAAYGLTTAIVKNMPAAATNLLLQNTKQKVELGAVIPYEVGAAATSSAVATAAWLGVPVLDADFVGRSVPEAVQMLPAIYGVDLCPVASADAFGNQSIITHSSSRLMMERMGKFLASASFGLIGQATLLSPAGLLKKYMLTGTLSKAFAVGQLLRKAREQGLVLESELKSLVGAKKIFVGTIVSFCGYEEKGYYVGDILIDGVAEDHGSQLKIWFKNENHVAWKNQSVCLTSPDLISVIDQKTLVPYVNNQLKEGMEVAVYGVPAHDIWLKAEALQVNSPRYYGFDFDAKLMGR